MNYAVVKFLNESNNENITYQEVPSSWLTKDNTFCKWPTKHAAIYIAKNFKPQDDWEEHPVEVEVFCETLNEAKNKVTESQDNGNTGRGFRTIKPLEYFSPDEEEQRLRQKKKAILDSQKVVFNVDQDFVKLLTSKAKCVKKEENEIQVEFIEDAVSSNKSDINDKDYNNDHASEDSGDSVLGVSAYFQDDKLQSKVDRKSGSSWTGNDITLVNSNLEKILEILVAIKVDIADLTERVDSLSDSGTTKLITESKLPRFPIETLADLENLEELLNTDEAGKLEFKRFIKAIGGHDTKDFTSRVFSKIMTNSLGEICSLTGRKNNYELGRFKLMKLIFGVLHHHTRCTNKDFEINVANWLRHSKQRREREEKREEQKKRIEL